MDPKHFAIFCGSSIGHHSIYKEAAIAMARSLHIRSIGIVYGGAKIGLMGALANEMLALGGEVIGIIPEKLMSKEVGHTGITQLHQVGSMHERKAMMASLSQGFIAMPGGIGTLEEIIEVFTWQQIGYHLKPCGLLNTQGFYDPLIQFMNHMVIEGFLSQAQRDKMIIENNPELLLNKMLPLVSENE